MSKKTMASSRILSAILVLSLLFLTVGSALAQDAPTRGAAPANDRALFLPIVGAPARADQEAAIMHYAVPLEEQLAAADYWTYERRVAAQPLMVSPVQPEESVDAAAAAQAELGTPGMVAGAPPARLADSVAQQEFADEWRRIQADLISQEMGPQEAPQELGTAGAYGTWATFVSYMTNYYNEMYKTYPYRAVGKLYIRNVGSCSASVISPYNIIVTAAHCVYDYSNHRWYTGWTFVPAERNGAAPYGTWVANDAVILTAYSNNGYMRDDVALVKLNTRSGRTVSYYTGVIGRAWNFGYTNLLHSIGYPSNLWNGNKYTYSCEAESFYGYSNVVGMGCDMMWGSSGGPWILYFAPYTNYYRNYVTSVVSGDPNISGVSFFGPRFTSDNIVGLCTYFGC